MTELFFITIFVLLALNTLFLIILLIKKSNNSSINKKLDSYEKNLKDEFERNRKETATVNALSRKENIQTLMSFQNSVTSSLTKFTDVLSKRMDSVSSATQLSLKNMQDGNEKKLEQMRLTVDEKLQSTLEKRLSTSFEVVSKQLQAVQNGLGAMQNLASDVGGLKRALTNVKAAGTMGEVQLENLLSQTLNTDQYEKNAHPNPSNPSKVVEFAVKIPAKEAKNGFIYIPIDSKYPSEVWDKLSLAYETGDKNEIELQRKNLVSDIKKFAKDIKEKYIQEPYTTNFGVMFLPFEGLYSEVIRIPGLFQQIQNDYRVTITGPTTLNAFLNSLQMGFRTLAIQKETSKIWELLGNVKTEFGKFGDVLLATKKKLESATNEIENAERRSRVIEKKLTNVNLISNDKSDDEKYI